MPRKLGKKKNNGNDPRFTPLPRQRFRHSPLSSSNSCPSTEPVKIHILNQEHLSLTSYASFSFSARILSALAWSAYGYKVPNEIHAFFAQLGQCRTFFSSSSISFHFAPSNLPISPARGTRLFLMSAKRSKGIRQRMSRAYRNRHQGSRP